MRAGATGWTPWAGVRRNLPLPRRCGGLRSDRPTPGDGPRPDQPIGIVDPLDGGRRPHGTRLSRGDRSPRRSTPPARKSRTPRMSPVRPPFGRTLWQAFDGLAGRRGSDSGGRPSFQGRDRRGHHSRGGADGPDAWRSGAAVMPSLSSSPAHTVWPAFGHWWHWRRGIGHRIGPSSYGFPCGAPSGEAQESIEQCGSATIRGCDGLPSGTRPRSRVGVAGERQGGKASR